MRIACHCRRLAADRHCSPDALTRAALHHYSAASCLYRILSPYHPAMHALPFPGDSLHCAAQYDPEDLDTLMLYDRERALGLLRDLGAPQRGAQARAHVAWLAQYGLHVTVGEVLALWEVPDDDV